MGKKENIKKVLIISYYWPPSGKATAHLPMRMAKYFPSFGLYPVILTVKKEGFAAKDESLLKDFEKNITVYRSLSFEPFGVYRFLIGKKKDEDLSPSETISFEEKKFIKNIALKIRMNFFIPDARASWIPFAFCSGKKIIRKENIDAIISIGPPHTCHIIGYLLAYESQLPHFPILIDPWADIFYYQKIKRSKFSEKIDRHLEKKVLEKAKKAIFINESIKESYIQKYPFLQNKSEHIYWGYDEIEFENLNNLKKTDKDEKVILHAGNFFDFQNPEVLWKAIRKKIDEGEKIKIKFTGTVGEKIKKSLEENKLTNCIEYLGLLPYKEALKEMINADYLLLCDYEPRHTPGKLFEYLRTGNQIIAFTQENKETEMLIEKYGKGKVFNRNDENQNFFEIVNKQINLEEYIQNFDRKRIIEKISNIILENLI